MVDVATAEHHGVCPECEGYGGRADDDDCQNAGCEGTCPLCWCPGCHDGLIEGLDTEQPLGSWEAYAALHPTPGPFLREQP